MRDRFINFGYLNNLQSNVPSFPVLFSSYETYLDYRIALLFQQGKNKMNSADIQTYTEKIYYIRCTIRRNNPTYLRKEFIFSHIDFKPIVGFFIIWVGPSVRQLFKLITAY